MNFYNPFRMMTLAMIASVMVSCGSGKKSRDNDADDIGDTVVENNLKVVVETDASALEKTVDILNRRLEKAGYDDFEVSKSGETTATVIMPVPIIVSRVLRILSSQGKLEVWATYNFSEIGEQLRLLMTAYASARPGGEEPRLTLYNDGFKGVMGFANAADTAQVNRMLHSEQALTMLPDDVMFLWGAKGTDLSGNDGTDYELFALKRDLLASAPVIGDNVATARSEKGFDSSWLVTFQLTDDASRRFEDFTRQNIGRAVAIVIDGAVYSNPVVNEAVTGGTCQISGNYTKQEANDVAIILTQEQLPAPVSIIESSEEPG